MMVNTQIKVLTKEELQNDPVSLQQLAVIGRQEEIESDFPFSLPDLDYYETLFALPLFPYDEKYYLICQISDKCVGYGIFSSNTKLDPKIGFFFIYVDPKFRRQKIAKSILNKIVRIVPKRISILSFSIRMDENAPEHEKRNQLHDHITKIAGKHKLKSRRSTSKLTEFIKDEIINKAELLKIQAIEKGFSFIFIKDGDFKNQVFKEIDYLRFLNSIVNDMPREELSSEDNDLTEDMFHFIYKHLEKLKKTNWTYVTVHNETSKPIAMTEVIIYLQFPEIIYQGDTGVYKDFRGKKLGLTLKYMMLARIFRNELTKESKYWSTFNANSNFHMININNELGHKEDALWYRFEISKENMIDYINQRQHNKF